MKKSIRRLVLSGSLLFLAACGSGGGVTTTPASTKAVVHIQLAGTLPGNTTISSADFILTLPANVTPALAGGEVASSVVTLTGSFAGTVQTPASYSPATASAPGTLRVTPINSAAAGTTALNEEIATITLQLAGGAAPVRADFGNLSSTSVWDRLYSPISGVSPQISGVTLQ